MGFGLACVRLTLTYSKGQGQGQTHFDSECHENYDIR